MREAAAGPFPGRRLSDLWAWSRWAEGRSCEEVASAMGVSPAMASSAVARVEGGKYGRVGR